MAKLVMEIYDDVNRAIESAVAHLQGLSGKKDLGELEFDMDYCEEDSSEMDDWGNVEKAISFVRETFADLDELAGRFSLADRETGYDFIFQPDWTMELDPNQVHYDLSPDEPLCDECVAFGRLKAGNGLAVFFNQEPSLGEIVLLALKADHYKAAKTNFDKLIGREIGSAGWDKHSELSIICPVAAIVRSEPIIDDD